MIGRGPLLLDFDGPICAIFANYSATHVAAELMSVLRARGVPIPPDVDAGPDPLAVLRWAGAPEVTAAIEDALIAAELTAAKVAEPTPFSRDVIVGARDRGVPVAVVSNNSTAAIQAYLSDQGLAPFVDQVIGRFYGEPSKMKPAPDPVLAAVEALGAQAARCTMVGDSLSDISAARAAKVSVIGYANKPWKREAFATADAVVTSMGEIAAVLNDAR